MLEWQSGCEEPIEDILDFLDDCGKFYTAEEFDAIIDKVNNLKADKGLQKRAKAWQDFKDAAEHFFDAGGAFEDSAKWIYDDIGDFMLNITRCE